MTTIWANSLGQKTRPFFVFRVMHFISYYSLYSQNLLLFLIVINRLKVVVYPLGETVGNNIWTNGKQGF